MIDALIAVLGDIAAAIGALQRDNYAGAAEHIENAAARLGDAIEALR